MMKNMFNGRKKLSFYIIILGVLLLSITLGSALLSSTLKIMGNSAIRKSSWIIYFDDIDIAEDSAPVDNSNDNARISKNGVADPTKQNIEFTASLKDPGDFYEFTVYTVNDGSIDAEVESLEKSILTPEQQKYLEFNVTYDDGTPIKECDILYHKGSEEGPNKRLIKAVVKYKSGLNIDDYPTEGVNLNLYFKINYSQNVSCEKPTEESLYKLTIRPNGGKYEGRTAQIRKYLTEGEEYVLSRPTRNLYNFDGWDVIDPDTGGTYHLEPYEDKYKFTMGSEDVIISAKWKDGDYVARIMDHYFTKVELAFDAVDGNDPSTGRPWENNTVWLLKDTEEVALNNARSSFTFNLDGHTLTGKIVNPTTGKITLVDGRIQGSSTVEASEKQRRIDEGKTAVPSINGISGEAVLNYGNLTLGINDGLVEVDNSISLLGSNYGVYNVSGSKMNFYDGYVDSMNAMTGISSQLNNGDIKIPTNYFIFVDHRTQGNDIYQKVYLTPTPNRAVAKTTTVIDTYYYNLQDAIETVTETKKANNSLTDNDYKIEAIRTFEAAYDLNIENDSRIFIDVKDYNVQIGENVTNNGYLKIYNSKNITSDVKLSKSITNNGSLEINKVNLPISTDADGIINSGSLKLVDTIMNSHVGYCVKNIENGTLDFNENVVLRSIHKNGDVNQEELVDNYALYNNGTSATVNGGTIYGIYNEGTLILDGESLNLVAFEKYVPYSGTTYIKAIYNKGNLIMNDGTATFDVNTPMITNIGTFTYNGGTMSSVYTTIDNAENYDTGTLYVKGSEISSDNITVRHGTVYVDGGTIRTSSTKGITDATVNVISGSVVAENGVAIGEKCTVNVSGGTITGTTVGVDTDTLNMTGGTINGTVGVNVTTASISGGTINGTTNGILVNNITMDGGTINSSEGVGLTVKTEGTITGGEIYGSTYGVLNKNTLTIGSDDGTISSTSPLLEGELFGLYIEGDTTNFYDGILKGQQDGYNGTITGTPLGGVVGEGTENRENNVVYQTDFVTNFEGWLRIGDVRYNSLNDATNAVGENETVTIIVTRNADITFKQELIDANKNKNITLDLNGYRVTTTQNITNNTNLTIVDSSEGTDRYPDTSTGPGTLVIQKNDGVVNLAKIIVNGGRYESTTEQVFFNKATDSNASDVGSFDLGIEVNKATFNVSNTTIRNGIYINDTHIGGYLRINGIKVESATNGIYNDVGKVVINGTKNNTTGKYTTDITGSNYGVRNESHLVVNGGYIHSDVRAISGDYNGLTVNEAKNINLDDDNQVASTKISAANDHAIYSYWSNMTINGGIITSENTTAVLGHHKITINGGSITGKRGVKSEEWCTYGGCTYEPIIITGGTIIGTQYEGVYSSGTKSYELTVTGGYILGQTDGIYSRSHATIGTKGETLSTENPEIRGVEGYGFNNDNGELLFYDGILKGKRKTGFDNASHNGMIRTVEDATMVKRDYEYINNVYYETEYLVSQGDWLEIEGKGKYNTVDKACEAASNGDTIKVIADTHIAFPQTCERNKTITFDLQDYSVSFTEPITFKSKTTFTGTGSLNNLRTDMIILEDDSTILSGTYTSVGGIALTNKKVLNITGGTFESTNKNTITNSGTITYNDIDDASSITSTEKYAVYNSGTFTLKKGNIISYGGIDNRGMLTIQDGRVEGLHTYSINSTDGNTYIEGGEIVNNVGVSVTVLCDANLTVSGTAKISSSVSNAITNNGNTGDYCDRSKLYVRGGEIVGKTMGITNSGFAYLEVTGGHIVGEDNTGININTVNAKLLGGVIEGGVYGVYTTENPTYPKEVRIGENDGNVSIDSPVLKGGSYGLFIEKGTLNFYDGILKGQVEGYSGQITNIADRTELYYDSETIDGLDYDTVYLLVESVIARNINKPSGELTYTEYTNLQDAFDEASNGDTIVLVANAPIYYPLTNEKDIELDMAGYTISTNKKITNNGELVIKNTSNEVSTIKTSSPLNLITNNNILTINNINIKNTSASNFVIKNLNKLTVTNSDIDCINGIDSNSELSIVNSTISATKNAINNSGKLNINQGTYTGGNYSIYSNSTGNTTIDSVTLSGVYYNYGNNTSTVSNSTINNELQNKDSNLTVSNSEFKDSISNNGTLTINESIFNGNIGDTINNSTTGTMNINDSTINIKSIHSINVLHFVGITNANRMTITNTTINHDKDYIDRSYIDTIENSGTLNINGTSRLVLGNLSKKDGSYAVLRATGGTATLDFDTVTVTKPNNTTEVVPNIDVIGAATNYGIYLDSEDAKVILKQGFVSATKASNTYGVYISNGDYTQGTYDGSGLETADVSRENPKIYSIGSNKGIGIKKLNGQLNFYDGIVYGSKYAKPDTTTKVEKNYEVTTYVDSDTGYEYAWLEYMPDDYIGSDLVASITRDLNTTNYSSLTEALQFASPGDEITLLKSTVENITINQGKIVKLNLNGRSLTGKITNNGILSIYNGSVQNFEDTTIVNNGELVMGQIEAPVSSTNIRIISEVKALDQKGTLTMYDGYIEGNPAMSGEINEIAEFSRIYTITDNQSEKIFLQSLDETSIRERETALLLTIDPIGGYYDGYKGAKTTGVYFGDTIKIKDPIKGGCTFLGWDTTGDITLVPIEEGTEDYDKGYRYQFTVGVKDITLTAQWQVSNEAVAKIGEDYFVSVEDAIVAAKEGDTIELIKDVTTDHITNDKDIILDLKGYKLTTELINVGVLRVIDGTIENPNGIGIWNKKTLIIGENDIETPSLDSVKIIGTNIGIKNDGGLKFYDGYIEGEVALVGDVEAVPQGYYLYIEHNAERQCQREYLIGNPQNAVAITKNDSGEESTVQYFFSLQDAIDSAAITGKEIFIIKTVPATYSLEVKEGKNVVINLNGNNIQLGNTFTNNGTLKLYDTYLDGEHGQIVSSQSITNNGTLNIKDINISQTKSENVIENSGTLNLENTTITALAGYAVNNEGTINVGDNTSLLANKYSILNNSTERLVLNKGTYSGIYANSDLTVGGSAVIDQTDTSSACIYVNNPNVDVLINNINCNSNYYGIDLRGISDSLVIKNGTITAKTYGIYAYNNSQNITIDGGTITSTTANTNYALYLDGRASSTISKNINATINGGTLKGKQVIRVANTNLVQNGGYLEATSTNSSEYIVSVVSNSKYTLNDGRLYALNASAINMNNTNITINGGEITLYGKASRIIHLFGDATINGGTMHADGIQSAGVESDSTASTLTMTDGSIYSRNIAINGASTTSTYNYDKVFTITGGSVVGENYGISMANSKVTTIIGDSSQEFDYDDPDSLNEFINVPYISGGLYAIHKTSGSVYFYNGRLRGSTYGYDFDFNGIRTSKDIYEEYAANDNYSKIKTFTTTTNKANATSDAAKQNNGYARITYIGETSDGCTNGTVKNFDYTGNEETFSAPCTGKYKLEVWGAQGGYARYSSYTGGYGGYSKGEIELTSGEILYINVGGKGTDASGSNVSETVRAGGYNGGGTGYEVEAATFSGGGGGATHIATSSGLLSTLSENRQSVLIVAGGGSGGIYYESTRYSGNSGGGYISGYTEYYPSSATQTSGYAFGTADTSETSYSHAGAGGGWYGGLNAIPSKVSGGGSGYIGNDRLSEAYMYGYNVETPVEGWVSNYLVSKKTFLKIGENGKYASFNEADIDIAENSTVELDVTSDADISEESILSSNKNITLDLNGFTLNFTQPLYNYSNLTIIDSSPNKTGKIVNNTTDIFITEGSITANGGTIEVGKKDKYAIIANGSNIEINMNSGTNITGYGGIKVDKPSVKIVNDGANYDLTQNIMYINEYKSDITIKSGNLITTASQGIYYYKSSSTTSNRGTLKIEGGYIKGHQNAVYTATVNATVTGGTFTNAIDDSSYGAFNSNSYTSLVINGGTFTSPKASAIRTNGSTTTEINGGTFNSDKYYGLYSYSGTTVINGGTFTATGTSSAGICVDYSDTNLTINDINISSTKYGILLKKNTSSSPKDKTINLYGGEVVGSTYGIYANDNRATLNIGNKDEVNNINKPRITGNIGLFRENGVINYYGGRLRGITKSYDTVFDTIRTGMAVHTENETVTENNTQVTYEISYLADREGFLQLDNDTEHLYSTFADAISHIPSGGSGEIKVLSSLSYNEEITFPQGKTVTVDLFDNTLELTQKIINNGNVTFKDSSENKNGYLNNIRTNVFENNGNLTINNIKLDSADYAIIGKSGTGTISTNGSVINGKHGIRLLSAQTVNMKDTTIEVTEYGIMVNSIKTNINLDTCSISGKRGIYYELYNSTVSNRSTLVIEDTDIIGNEYTLYLQNVNATFDGGTIDYTGSNYYSVYISSNASFTMEDGNVKGNNSYAIYVNGSSTSATINGGTVESKNHAIITRSSGELTVNGGTIKTTGNSKGAIGTDITKCTININGGNIIGVTYAIYLPSSSSNSNDTKTINIDGGNIYSDLYGVYIADTKTTLNIGKNATEFSTTIPELSGVLYGLYKTNGTVNFYSGRLVGGTGAYFGDFSNIREGYEVFEDNIGDSTAYVSRTYSTDTYSEEAISDSPKDGDGYAKITYIDSTNGDCIKNTSYDYPYSGEEETFNVTCPGKYRLEVWGAAGGGSSYRGYGSYSVGEIELTSGEILYINVGGQGGSTTNNLGASGGYNGGGSGGNAYSSSYKGGQGGGGATHIATHSGLLSTLENNKSSVLIVAGGGAGTVGNGAGSLQAGHAGGVFGNNGQELSNNKAFSYGGTQNTGYAFGIGANGANGISYSSSYEGNGGSGGGWYGGNTIQLKNTTYQNIAGAGGSGYIGNTRLSNKYMIGYDVAERYPTGTLFVAYLRHIEELVVNNTTHVGYTNLQDAIDHASSNDVLELTRDSSISYDITVEDPNLTLDLHGFELKTNKKINITEDFTITNLLANSNSKLYNNLSGNLIVNDANLTISNVEVSGNNTIKNTNIGTLTISNSTINGSGTTIENLGLYTITDSTITGKTYAIYDASVNKTNSVTNSKVSADTNSFYMHDKGTNNFVDTDFEGKITNNSTNGTISISKNNKNNISIDGTINNKGTLTIGNAIITGESTTNGLNESHIANSGILTINNSTITYTDTGSKRDYQRIIINNTGTLTSRGNTYNSVGVVVANSNVKYNLLYGIYNKAIMESTNDTFTSCDGRKAYPIFNESTNNTVVNNANITINNTSNYDAGIYNKTGNLTVNTANIEIYNGTSSRGIGSETSDANTLVSDLTVNIHDINGDAYGMYVEDGQLQVTTGTVTVSGTNAYGVYMLAGDYLQGTFENTGVESTNTSITNPNISATGTSTGIGISMGDGRFMFYDGYVHGSTRAFAVGDLIYQTEYRYHEKYLDNGTTCILEFDM